MKRSWIFTGVLAAGFVFAFIAAFTRLAAPSLLSVGVTLGVLVGGIAALLWTLNENGALPLRNHFDDHRKTYAVVVAYLGFFAASFLVLVVYVFFISIGQWTVWPPTTAYYDRLAGSLAAGHISMDDRPDPALLALPNPYDPDSRKGIPGLGVEQPGTIWDMSLYQGKVYLYWGPAPALILAAVKTFYPAEVGDHQLTFVFLLGCFIFEALIIFRVWRRFFAEFPVWVFVAALLLAGFANPVLWVLSIPRIYEAAIAAGQFFLIGGLLFALDGLDRPNPSIPHLALAGVLFVCAAGSRATLAFPVAFLCLMVLLRLWYRRRDFERHPGYLAPAAAFAIPVVLGAALLGWYNLARFGSVFEFGFRYAITMLDQNKNHGILFSPIYLGPNISLYLFNPPTWDALFPFVRPIWNEELISAFNARFHTIYNAERIIGLIYAAPFLLFALLLPALMLVDLARQRLPRAKERSTPTPETTGRFLRWLVVALAGSALLEVLVVFFVFYGTMRYLLDATPTLVLLSLIGCLLGFRRLQNRPLWKAVYVVVAVGLLLATIIMGLLLGFASNIPRIRAANPALLNHLRLYFITLARHIPG